MIKKGWCWAGARSVGTSHIKANEGCEDYASVIEKNIQNESILIAAVSDGAGSAKHAELGSRMVVRGFMNAAILFFKDQKSLSQVTEEVAKEWIDAIRDRISIFATNLSATPKDFAATLVGVVIGYDRIIVCHVGDGGCVARNDKNDWIVPSWPSQGEYASTTFFVTDDPFPNLKVTISIGRYKEIAIFSDGIERLALNFATTSAFSPFFDQMFYAFESTIPGRDRASSRGLKAYLDGTTVTDRTDDDKTLILARGILE